MSPGPGRSVRAEAIKQAREDERARFKESVDRIVAERQARIAQKEHEEQAARERDGLREEYRAAAARLAEETIGWIRELLAVTDKFGAVVEAHNAARKIRDRLVKMGEPNVPFPQPYWGYEDRHWSHATGEVAHALDRDTMRPTADTIGRYAYDLVRAPRGKPQGEGSPVSDGSAVRGSGEPAG